MALRRDHPVFRRPRFLQIRRADASEPAEVAWFSSVGHEVTEAEWSSGQPAVAMFLNGETIADPSRRGEPVVDDSFLVILNPGATCLFQWPDMQ